MGVVPPVLMSSWPRHSDFSWAASVEGESSAGLDSEDEVVGLRLKVICARRARFVGGAAG